MAHSWMARLGSVFTLIGALLLLLSILLVNAMYIPSLFFSLYQNPAFVDAEFKFIAYAPFVISLCLLAGLVSLLLVQQSWWGRVAGGVAVFGGLLTVVTIVWLPATTATQLLPGWLYRLSDVPVALGLMMCGIVTLKARVLPRWNVIPLLLGVLLAFLTATTPFTPSFFYSSFSSNTSPPFPNELWVFLAQDLLEIVLWMCLGIALWPRKQVTLPQATQLAIT